MINQEDFDKLKQSDRIEFLLREDRLEKKKDGFYFSWISVWFLCFGIIGFIILLSLQFKILGFEESFIRIFGLIIPMIKVMIIVGGLGVCWNLIIRSVLFLKWDKQLELKFFKKEVKPIR